MSTTIVAVGTPPGTGDLGIVRLSGEDTAELLSGIATLPRGRGAIATRLQLNELDLPCTVLWMPGPHSYTSEDVAELILPGNPLLLQQVVQQLIDRGRQLGLATVLAPPGEFTRRAWSAGQVTFAQAESLMARVHAETDDALDAADRAAHGAVHASIAEVAIRCRDLLALVEAGIDFTDEEDVVIAPVGELQRGIETVRTAIRALQGAAGGRLDDDAAPLVRLRGAPSAGKSTLFNTLLGRTRSVTMAQAHTTRDELIETLLLPGGMRIRLADTPGRDGSTPLDHDVDLTVWCVPWPQSTLESADGLTVQTKADLADGPLSGLAVSAHTGMGIDALREAMEQSLLGARRWAGAAALSARQAADLAGVDVLFAEGSELIHGDAVESASAAPEVVAMVLREALDRLGAMSDDIPPDDVLGVVFASFCVGK
ncbi:MAG: 50S ribosome-binding GTPase [Phycisphaerales bacterium]|nr:50S ribosome-binding GTPase [Phycisphaerales bacterium]